MLTEDGEGYVQWLGWFFPLPVYPIPVQNGSSPPSKSPSWQIHHVGLELINTL